MKINNDERREVAARLREVRSVPEWATTACCIAELIGEYDYPLWDSSKQLFDLLADLIEPEPEHTCQIESCEEFDERGIWAIELSCGHADVYCVMQPNYCSCCGAKVVEK